MASIAHKSQDLRNHGSSSHHQTHNYPSLAADILNFLTQHNISSPTLIGHSMGAKACMALALWKPDRIGNLVAVDNAPVDAALKSDFHQYVQGMKEVDRVGVKSQKEADAVLQPYVKVGEE
jgi:pimeloyl-ACP methyl ester carboxylesterase